MTIPLTSGLFVWSVRTPSTPAGSWQRIARLRNRGDALSRLCRLQVEDNVTVVLLSEIVWDKFRPTTGCFEPLLLHFPDYSRGGWGLRGSPREP